MRQAAGAALLALTLGVLGAAQAQQRITAAYRQYYFVPGLTTCAKGAQREAAVKFPKFITPADTHRLRLQQTENPGRPPSCPYWPCSWCCIDRS